MGDSSLMQRRYDLPPVTCSVKGRMLSAEHNHLRLESSCFRRFTHPRIQAEGFTIVQIDRTREAPRCEDAAKGKHITWQRSIWVNASLGGTGSLNSITPTDFLAGAGYITTFSNRFQCRPTKRGGGAPGEV